MLLEALLTTIHFLLLQIVSPYPPLLKLGEQYLILSKGL